MSARRPTPHSSARVALSLLLVTFVSVGCDGEGGGSATNASNDGIDTGTGGAAFGFDLAPFADILLVYHYEYGISGYLLEQTPVMTFADGSATRDLIGLLASGPEASRASRPEDWGEWRGSHEAETLELRWSGEADFEGATAANASVRPASDERLAGCYTATDYLSLPGFGIGNDTTSLSFDTFCFQDDGLFSNAFGSSTITPDFVAGTGRDTAGRYRIDGHVIELAHGNGEVRHALFGLYDLADDPRFGVSIGDTVFTRPLEY